MIINKLKNAPLKEVIVEISWEENVDEFGNKFDLGFELAQGKFSEIIKPWFPIHKKLYRVTYIKNTYIYSKYKDMEKIFQGENILEFIKTFPDDQS
ncbi:hypothetical protein, partial [Flavobacterium sp. ZS1P14]|uniref:hypothetical protein n=1 Tax=Flavobacterium sp. ZS1P14 TaxID=3401729 RepID=UPI003AADF606